jgi:hypothetical protein
MQKSNQPNELFRENRNRNRPGGHKVTSLADTHRALEPRDSLSPESRSYYKRKSRREERRQKTAVIAEFMRDLTDPPCAYCFETDCHCSSLELYELEGSFTWDEYFAYERDTGSSWRGPTYFSDYYAIDEIYNADVTSRQRAGVK